jgi:hypothetical protein
MSEGSRAQSVQAMKAPMADAARDAVFRVGDIEMKAKNAMIPVENTMIPLQICKKYYLR